MIKIGIPNRSSLLHVAGVAQCIRAGILSASEYDPARLMYASAKWQIVLARCKELCKMIDSKTVDFAFVGNDYAEEHGCTEWNEQLFTVLPTDYALLASKPINGQINKVYTKFPKTARKLLDLAEVNYKEISHVSGASETYCLIENNSVSFDVVCTRSTVISNKLTILKKFKEVGSSWYGIKSFPKPLLTIILDDKFHKTLCEKYKRIIVERDSLTRDRVLNSL